MKEKRTKLQKRDGIQRTLESYRRFDYDYIPFGKNWIMPNENFSYRQKFFDRIITGFWRTVMAVFGPLLIGLVYGARVKGRKNLKALKGKGAICVSNHFSYLDTLFVRQAVGHYRSFHTMAPYNNKKGLGGHIVRHGGMWAFSANLTAMRNLYREMERRLKQGKIVNFYAEQAMWVNYQKPRPMKDGAFFYAVKYDVPVLPVFCTFKKDKKGRMHRLRINILPPVFIDETLKKGERIQALKNAAQAEWQECYENAYSVPLEYEKDVRKNAK